MNEEADMRKTGAKSQDVESTMITSDGRDMDDITIAEAAEICGYTPRWLRQMIQEGYFPKKENGRVRLRDVVRGFERQIGGWKPPGFEGGYRR
jgi:hypothetical protein